MDKNIITQKYPVFRAQDFRTPVSYESETGLWVERIGTGISRNQVNRLRLLSRYAVVGVEEGSGIFLSTATGQVKVDSGDAIIVFPEVASLYYPEKTWRSWWIMWNGSESEIYQNTGCLSPAKPVIKNAAGIVKKSWMQLKELMEEESMLSILRRKIIVLQMIIELMELEQAGAEDQRSRTMLDKVIRYIDSHPDTHPSLEKLAQLSGYSKSHFRRLFKTYTGRNPKDFIISSKINKAKRILSEGASINETASLLGYDDVFYFMRVFKKFTGQTAGKFS